jgi:type III pantothenate kinase
MKLLIDFGNTRLKWASLADGRMLPGGVFAHVGKPLPAELRSEWAKLARVEAVLVASVVATKSEDELCDFVHERFGVRAAILHSPAFALGVRNAYAEPARLGIDRFLALAALHGARARAQVLASVGTALTLDALGADGRHHGGLIVASPQLMREAIRTGTARVCAVDGHFRDMPDNTADAVVSGALYAAIGAIDRFCAVAAMRLGTPPTLVLTGGGADELASLAGGAERAHDLVLRGLALWADAQGG